MRDYTKGLLFLVFQPCFVNECKSRVRSDESNVIEMLEIRHVEIGLNRHLKKELNLPMFSEVLPLMKRLVKLWNRYFLMVGSGWWVIYSAWLKLTLLRFLLG